MTPTTTDRAIVLTPPGVAAIAVVRLVGPGVAAWLDRHFSRADRLTAGRCVHGELRDDAGEVIDDPLVFFDPDRHVADLSLHGGVWVVHATLELARRGGFVVAAGPARPESVPLDPAAVDADDPLEREMLEHLPAARTELALRTLLAQPAAWGSLLARSPSPDELRTILADRSLEHLLRLPTVAIVGEPNVGKSTLANRLFEQQRSIEADLPGTTRDWVGEVADLDGLAVLLVDTPGQRPTDDAIEHAAIRRSHAVIGAADLVVVVLDASRPMSAESSQLLDRHRSAVVVLNKFDRLSRAARFPGEAIATVASRGEGIDALRRAIRTRFGCDAIDPSRPRTWTSRQRECLRRVLDAGETLDSCGLK
jgi:tRNA modification GTPase